VSDLDGAAVLVTGASGGLGAPITPRLAEAGARLVVSARDVARLTDLPDGVHGLAGDLRRPGDPQAVVEQAVAHLGRLDGLVHAAGVVAFGPIADADDDLLDELFLADALGPIRLIRAALPHLRTAAADRPGAFAAVISAVVAEQPMPNMAAYSAAKAALSTFTLACAKEVRRHGVRVIDIRPPHTETGLATRPVAGTAPRLPHGLSPDLVADRVVRAITDDERDLPASAFG
jgi:cyclic-di-GMP-binding biofilm dispersal mediator protein